MKTVQQYRRFKKRVLQDPRLNEYLTAYAEQPKMIEFVFQEDPIDFVNVFKKFGVEVKYAKQ